jgi:hypothetical protein
VRRAADKPLQMYEGFPDNETVLARLDRLVQDVIQGSIRRNSFHPWEVELLLDIRDCSLPDGALRRALRRYQKTVRRKMDQGAALLRFSEFIQERPREPDESHLVF